MDAVAQLALMTKAKLVFESEDTFLSFPARSPLSYSAKNLQFAKAATPETLITYSEFSRETNIIPRGPIFQIEEGESLWEMYTEIFKNAEIAQSTLTPDEAAEYQNAISLLRSDTPDGLHADSPQLALYKQYRDASIKANEEYLNRKTSAGLSNDPAVKSQWNDTDEPLLRQQAAQIDADWTNNGFKAEVEHAQMIETQCASRSPDLQWNEWSSSFDPKLDLMTDPNSQQFAITSFSPYDVFDNDDWSLFELNSDEIAQLVNQAPPELKQILGANAANSKIDSISFEYRSVSVARPWFRPEVFSARFWRFSNASQLLSDGGNPPNGLCPAYVAALVFARNIQVTTRESSGALRHAPVASLPPVFRTLPKPMVATAGAGHAVIPIKKAVIPTAVPPRPTPTHAVATAAHAAATHAAAQAPHVQAKPVPHPAASVTPKNFHTAASPVRMNSVAALRIPPAIGHPPATPLSVHPKVSTSASVGHNDHAPLVVTHPGVKPATTPVIVVPKVVPASTQPVVTPQKTVTILNKDDVSIIAFICKRLQKAPDPDPTMQWTTVGDGLPNHDSVSPETKKQTRVSSILGDVVSAVEGVAQALQTSPSNENTAANTKSADAANTAADSTT
jgi:hypothetical protein